MRQRSSLLLAVALTAASSVALAQTVIRCGGGTTVTAGMVINSAGELVFPEQSIICGATASPLPPALAMSIVSPGAGEEVNVTQGAQAVPFTANLTNFTSPYDQCPNVRLTPPVGAATNIPLNIAGTPPNITANATFNFGPDAITGIYQAALNCSRVIDNQQVLLNPPSVQFSVVGGGVEPVNCDPLPAIMNVNLKNFTDPHPNGFGVAFGAVRGDTVFSGGNQGLVTAPLSPPAVLNVRSWRFTAPSAPVTGTIGISPGAGAAATSIASCPGVYAVAGTCRKSGNNSQMKWSTKPNEPGACLLEPGQTYYFNGAHFSLSDFASGGVYNSSCGCANPPCGGCSLVYQLQGSQ